MPGPLTISADTSLDFEPAAQSSTSLPLGISVFSDGAVIETMVAAYKSGAVQGFTTNPTLMAKAGVRDYAGFAQAALAAIPDLPICLEVLADDLPGIERQAREIASWGGNVFVKIPVMTTKRVSTIPLVRRLAADGLQINVTAVMSFAQVEAAHEALDDQTTGIISIFAGRIADTGRDPCPTMRDAVRLCRDRPNIRVLWASPREVRSVYQAAACGCHIITLTPDIAAKLPLRDKDLEEFSRETVQMFYDDAQRAGFRL